VRHVLSPRLAPAVGMLGIPPPPPPQIPGSVLAVPNRTDHIFLSVPRGPHPLGLTILQNMKRINYHFFTNSFYFEYCETLSFWNVQLECIGLDSRAIVHEEGQLTKLTNLLHDFFFVKHNTCTDARTYKQAHSPT